MFKFPKARDYASIEEEDDDDKETLPHHLPTSAGRTFRHRYWAYFTHGTLIILCIALWLRGPNQPSTLPYSPANEVVEYEKELRTFKGAFNYTSIYRGTSPEVDAAWLRVSTGVSAGRITKEQLLMLGEQDTPSKVKYRQEDGGGYMAALEVAHQLHCLDMLRKNLHFDYYRQIDHFIMESTPEMYMLHLDHCVDNLRQVLMCSADVGIITYEWVKGNSKAYPNFNTKHQCRNFEKIISWGMDNAVDIPNSRITRLEGEIDLSEVP